MASPTTVYVVYRRATGRITGVYLTADEAQQVRLFDITLAHISTDNLAVRRGWYVDTSTTPATVGPNEPAAIKAQERRRSELAVATRGVVQRFYRWAYPLWAETDYHTTPTGAASANACQRWAYHHAALRLALETGAALADCPPAVRMTLYDGIDAAITPGGVHDYTSGGYTGGYAALNVMFGLFEGNTTARTAWAAMPITAGSPVNADLMAAAGRIRTPDGSRIPITGAVIPAADWPTLDTLT